MSSDLYTALSSRVVPLTSMADYFTWLADVKACIQLFWGARYLDGRSLKPVAGGAKPDGTRYVYQDVMKWEDKDEAIKAFLGLCVGPHARYQIEKAASAKAAWEWIETMYKPSGPGFVHYLQNKLSSLRLRGNEDADEHCRQFSLIAGQLALSDAPLSPLDLANKLLWSLDRRDFTPTLYIVNAWPAAERTFERIQHHLVMEQMLDRLQAKQDAKELELFQKSGSTSQGKSPVLKSKEDEPKCANCQKTGHEKKDCWVKGGAKEGEGPRQKQKIKQGKQ